MRIAFSLGILGSILMAVGLQGVAAGQGLAYLSILPVLGNLYGTWVVFGSRAFKSYLRSAKRRRGIYD